MDRRRFLSASGLSLLAGCDQVASVVTPRPTTGFDPALLAATLSQAETLPRLHAMVVARDGQRLSERVFRGPGLETPVNVKSASKSVLAAVAGAALGAGVLESLEQPISTWLSDRFPAAPDPRLNRITVENLLSMQAGLESTSGANYGAWVSSRDWVRFALAQPFVSDPGETLIYSTGASHLLSAALTRAGGVSTRELTRRWLGEPLGFEVPQWPVDPQGIHFGGNDMNLSPLALLSVGELYRNDGVHQGQRVCQRAG